MTNPHDGQPRGTTGQSKDGGPMHGSYARFALMIATSTAVMWVLMYATVLQWSHVWFSQTRASMAVFMGAAMAIVMLGFMRLADAIIAAQREEIAEMEALIAELSR